MTPDRAAGAARHWAIAALIGIAAAGGATSQRLAPVSADAAALQLLALLQHEGRFIDFLEEDLDPHSDAQIGAAVRAIHKGCRSIARSRAVCSTSRCRRACGCGSPRSPDAACPRSAQPRRGFMRHATAASITANIAVSTSAGSATSARPAPRSMMRRSAIWYHRSGSSPPR